MFKQVYEELQRKQDELNRKIASAKKDAVAYVQEIITDFGIKRSELHFAEEGAVTARKSRNKAPVKYRLPNGVEWTGKGNMKKEVRQYLEDNNLTAEDLTQFLTEQFQK